MQNMFLWKKDKHKGNWKQPCTNFLVGNCTRDDCKFKHVSYEELGKMLKAKNKSPAPTNGTNSKTKDEKKKQVQFDNKQVCLQYKNTGSCQYGDRCRFEHAAHNETDMVQEMELKQTRLYMYSL